MQTVRTDTPWRRVFAHFGMHQAEFARALGKDRSKISRALKDKKGLISGRDQELIIAAARTRKISVPPEAMIPTGR